MKLIYISIASLILAFSNLTAKETSHHILVSVAPHKFFVEKIAGEAVTVGLMVPAGASAHTFEPTPKQMMTASQADLWFCIGESFETRAIKALTSHRPELAIVDLRKDLDMITADPFTGCCCCHANCQDLHIWLSARQAKIQAKTIADALINRYPEQTAFFQTRLESFIKELEALDNQISMLLQPLKNRLIMVSHPAYAYFCRDYNLIQLSIEFEGKDPTPYQLNTILNRARQAQITKVYIQPQYPSKGAKLFAAELNAEVVTVDPYSEDYVNTMLRIARAFSNNN